MSTTTNFLAKNLQFDFAQTYLPAIQDGRFSMVNKTVVRTTHLGSQYNADLELRADFSYAGRNKRVEIDHLFTNYAGYNRKYISDVGVYDPSLSLDEFARVVPEKRIVKNDTFALLSNMVQRDSHELYIYNMLISWGRALLYKAGGFDDFVLRVKTAPYDDTHVTIALDQGTREHTYDIRLGMPVSVMKAEADSNWLRRDTENYWSRPYVLHYNAAAVGQEEFYLLHSLGRTETSALNFDVMLPGIESKLVLLEPVNGGETIHASYDQIPWDSPETIWGWIHEYVRLNRLEAAFGAAFETFGAMSAHPRWGSAEACAWQRSQLVIALGAFSPTRARLRTNLEGEPLSVSPAPAEFMINESRAPEVYLQSSALINYYMWYGHYAMVHDAARARDNWRAAYTSVEGDLAILHGPFARAASVSAITGHEFTTLMHYGCGMRIDMSQISHVTSLTGFVNKDHALPDVLPVDAVFAPVMGGLILGAVAGPYEALSHLKSLQHLPQRDATQHLFTIEELVVTANLYRLYGHDVEIEDKLTGRRKTPWATAHECIIEPSSVGFDPTVPSYWMPRDSRAREGRHHTMPNVVTMCETGPADVMIMRPMIKIVQWMSRKVTVAPFKTFTRPPVRNVFKIVTPFSVNPSAIVAHGYKPPKFESGFRRDITDTTPRNPEGPAVLETYRDGQSHVDTGMPSESADGVDPST